MATKPRARKTPATRKPTPAETAMAEWVMRLVLDQHSKAFWNAEDGEVNRILVSRSFELSRTFHAHEVRA
jgi:hypothetical protein